MFVGSLALFVSRGRMLFGLLVLARSMVMPRLVMMMRSGGVMSGCLLVVFGCWMFR